MSFQERVHDRRWTLRGVRSLRGVRRHWRRVVVAAVVSSMDRVVDVDGKRRNRHREAEDDKKAPKVRHVHWAVVDEVVQPPVAMHRRRGAVPPRRRVAVHRACSPAVQRRRRVVATKELALLGHGVRRFEIGSTIRHNAQVQQVGDNYNNRDSEERPSNVEDLQH